MIIIEAPSLVGVFIWICGCSDFLHEIVAVIIYIFVVKHYVMKWNVQCHMLLTILFIWRWRSLILLLIILLVHSHRTMRCQIWQSHWAPTSLKSVFHTKHVWILRHILRLVLLMHYWILSSWRQLIYGILIRIQPQLLRNIWSTSRLCYSISCPCYP